MAFCINCGLELMDDFEYCPQCGIKIELLENKDETQQQYDEQPSADEQPFAEAQPFVETQTFVDTQTPIDDYTGKIKVCRVCGTQTSVYAFCCPTCGRTFSHRGKDFEFEFVGVNADMQTGVWRNKWTSLLLCLFFGWCGVHRFYEGKVITGLLYLFTFGLYGLGWLVDIIIIAGKPNPYRTK